MEIEKKFNTIDFEEEIKNICKSCMYDGTPGEC